ncbi:undecaprenyldiphospho-muramoylpentapeptide beta-N-acetylglucosaminyltransferase [Desulfocurvibacter africanus]|uniref:undecaprenyldiphospho-muramoylpentapeptide beta-N-acetylglucosaminyltransferase n=1 Tax=Desulfocurvibacter africanus TaxID=873 RepID=UPI000403EEF7|nr:undecaprenyldiphospho-muramoylpentapeptide beta-N-acetylglucosaminyltransferase [Desulfocurvibacter africanus]
MRIVLTTGGTGGHIFPALAVAEEIKRRHPDGELLFLGGTYGPEGRMAAEAGIPFRALAARGVIGRGVRSVGSIFWITRSVLESLWVLWRYKPQAVIGFGGYASFCPVLAAKWLGIPTLIHEQNSMPGVVNRVLGRYVRMVLISYTDEHHCFDQAKTELTGNPVRAAIRGLRDGNTEQRPTGRRILILGGSQGSKTLNDAVVSDLPKLAKGGIELWHQTGEKDLESVRRSYAAQGYTTAKVDPFIKDMAAAYGWADLVICRAGATTLSELTVAGKPSVLVPFPHATHDHQSLNAQALAERGAAVMVSERKLAETGLFTIIQPLLEPERLMEMGRSAAMLGMPDAAARVADALEAAATERI